MSKVKPRKTSGHQYLEISWAVAKTSFRFSLRMTNSQTRDVLHCQSQTKLKVVKSKHLKGRSVPRVSVSVCHVFGSKGFCCFPCFWTLYVLKEFCCFPCFKTL